MRDRFVAFVAATLICVVGSAQKTLSGGEWRTATAAELSAVLPLRAPVVKERIETEMRSATGVIDARGHVIAAVVLITAGYAANGKYSHYLLAQTPMRLGKDLQLPAGAYVIGWTRGEESLQVHIYDAATGVDRGSIEAPMLPRSVTVVPIRIWPPSERSIIQIGRFMIPYTPGA
jgi:hypothetical protein